MKRNILIPFLFLLSLNGSLFSQNITIEGKIVPPSSHVVRLLTYDDMLTGERSTVFETKSDDKGNFKIEADKLIGDEIFLDVPSVGATINIMLRLYNSIFKKTRKMLKKLLITQRKIPCQQNTSRMNCILSAKLPR